MSVNAKHITIHPDGDLTVRVIEYDHEILSSDAQPLARNIAFMKVSRSVLQNSSETFRNMLDPKGRWFEGSQSEVSLEDDTVASMEIWFRQLHGSMTPEMNEVPVEEVWHVIEASRKYFFKLEVLNTWYSEWWGHQNFQTTDVDGLRESLFPSHEFKDAKAFAYATKNLAYHWSGHITEINPTYLQHLHLRPLVIQQINAAKGSLRTNIHRGLFAGIQRFLDASCDCKEKTLFAYCRSLYKTNVWPLEEHALHNSIHSLLEGLKKFQYEPPKDSCLRCRTDMTYKVKKTREKVLGLFDGLCLDCMDISKTKTGDVDLDYWKHDSLRTWDFGCRFRHDQPSWYFSFMGRKEAMDAYRARQKNRQG